MISDLEVEICKMALLGAMEWSRNRTTDQLRSPALKPQYQMRDFGSGNSMPLWLETYYNLGQWKAASAEVQARRADLVSSSMPDGGDFSTIIKKNVFVYFPNRSAVDGQSAAATENFFDNDDVPPWDTWVHYILDFDCIEDLVGTPSDYSKACLICYVDDRHCDIAARGIESNMAGCLAWYRDLLGDKSEYATIVELLTRLSGQ
jgi:hypothetical protein